MNGKLKIYFALISAIENALKSIGINRKKKVLIDCSATFHYHHIKPVVNKLIEDDKVHVYLLATKRFSKKENLGELVDKHKFISHKTAKFIKFDLSISLDYSEAWIPHRGIRVFAPHGDGMKSNFSGCHKLAQYDVVFAVGKRQEDQQLPYLKHGAVTEKIGFIITDQLFNNSPNKTQALEELGFHNELPVVLYAPSWSNNPDKIMMTENILYALSGQQIFNVIFKPHPNLLIPEQCGGKNWGNVFSQLPNDNFHVVNKSLIPIQAYMLISNILVSDISSVIYEYLFLDKPILLHVDKSIIDYYDGADAFGDIHNAAFQFRDSSDMLDAIISALKESGKHSEIRKHILREKYYNPGKAAQVAVDAIYRHL